MKNNNILKISISESDFFDLLIKGLIKIEGSSDLNLENLKTPSVKVSGSKIDFSFDHFSKSLVERIRENQLQIGFFQKE